MEKLKLHKSALVASITIVLLALILVAVYLQTTPERLYPQEIREYQGQNLSSIADDREEAIKGTQVINASTYRLTITGLVNKTLQYTYNDIVNAHQKYQKVVTLHCVKGWTAKILWEGILIRDLILEAGNKSEAKVLIFTASDGYTTSLPLDYFFSNAKTQF